MIKNNQFTLNTRFGNVAVKINGVNSFYVSARLNRDDGCYGEQEPFLLTIRNKTYNHFSIHCALKSNNTIDGKTYAADGNTSVFVSEYNPGNSYYKQRAVWCNGMTAASKEAFYNEVIIKLNEFYSTNEIEIRNVWGEIAENNHLKEIESINEEINELKQKLAEKQEILFNLENHLEGNN